MFKGENVTSTKNRTVNKVRLLVEDLRTPGLIQATRYLTVPNESGADGDCCLGRGCKVAIANGLKGVEAIRTGTNVDYRYIAADPIVHLGTQEHHEGAVLPPPVAEWYGFDKINPLLTCPDGSIRDATSLNDELKWNFEQIAYAFEVTFLDGTYPADAITWPGMPRQVLQDLATDEALELG